MRTDAYHLEITSKLDRGKRGREEFNLAGIIILKSVLGAAGFVISYESLKNMFILGMLVGISAIIISIIIPDKR